MYNKEVIKIMKEFRDRQRNSEEDIEAFDLAINVIEAFDAVVNILNKQTIDKTEILYKIFMESVNMTGEYQGCWVRFRDIEKIIDKYMN